MKKRYIINLPPDERASLEDLAKRQRVSALKPQRALILLRPDDDLTDAEIAEELEAGRATVERVRRRCVERSIAASHDRKPQERPSIPRKFDGAAEARLVQIACSPPPAVRARWTLSLLGDRLVELRVFEAVSKSSIQRTLRKKRAQALASRALLHPAREERCVRSRDGGPARRLPSALRRDATRRDPSSHAAGSERATTSRSAPHRNVGRGQERGRSAPSSRATPTARVHRGHPSAPRASRGSVVFGDRMRSELTTIRAFGTRRR